jgi:hypothetical protein
VRDTHSWDRHDAIFLSFHLFFPPCAWAWDVYSLLNENPLEMGGEGGDGAACDLG